MVGKVKRECGCYLALSLSLYIYIYIVSVMQSSSKELSTLVADRV